ncbi:HD domain-containing protein [Neobittarella massiliensis]|uniref:HD domain-containing protein n=1 Tax=Neobittarella massiliensis (ex Bilen et al. 2018) TaxID=2041842 RepID=UPI000CF718F1|nr:HD domain-containing protein [Neobittarella massiliensis]
MSEFKQEFLQIYRTHIARTGADKLLAWLETTDFFTAPASTRFHGSYPGGLCEHSVHVYQRLRAELAEDIKAHAQREESIAICALLHDLCKANFYKVSTRNVKNEQTGKWEKAPFYQVEDQFPYGHGEKSVFLIERFIRLSTEEAVAIRWHMGGYDEAVKGGSYAQSAAFDKYPLALALHLADMQATHMDEISD